MPANNPSDSTSDVASEISRLIGDAGTLRNVMGAFRIKVRDPRAFPFADVFNLLLAHGFKVDVTSQQAALLIEARP